MVRRGRGEYGQEMDDYCDELTTLELMDGWAEAKSSYSESPVLTRTSLLGASVHLLHSPKRQNGTDTRQRIRT